MTLLRFHIVGEWDEASVRTAWGTSSHVLPPEVRDEIERMWQTASARRGVKLFDGPMCRLESWSERPAPDSPAGTLRLVLSRTSYKMFMGTNLSHPELADRYGRQVLANPVGVSPALETADGFLMLGRRNSNVAYYPSRIHPFAGCLEPVESQGAPGAPKDESDEAAPGSAPPAPSAPSAPNVFAAVRRELFEELGFTTEDVAEMRCTGIAEDVRLRQPELIFRVKSARSRARIEAQVARDEHHESWSVPATAGGVELALADSRLTPVAVASLLLWGRGALGRVWFEEQAGRFTGAGSGAGRGPGPEPGHGPGPS